MIRNQDVIFIDVLDGFWQHFKYLVFCLTSVVTVSVIVKTQKLFARDQMKKK